MKRYKYIPTVITVFLVVILAIGGIILWLSLNQESETQSTESTESTVPTTTVPEQDYTLLDLDNYDLPIDNTTINDDTIYQILSHADQLLSQYKTITFERTEYHNRFFQYNIEKLSDYITIKDGTITIDADKYVRLTNPVQNPSVHYLVFVTLISNEYAFCIAEKDFVDYGQNRILVPTLVICPDYQEAGYDSAQCYFDAWWNDECELRSTIYDVSLYILTITDSGSLTNHYDEYFDIRSQK